MVKTMDVFTVSRVTTCSMYGRQRRYTHHFVWITLHLDHKLFVKIYVWPFSKLIPAGASAQLIIGIDLLLGANGGT